LGFLPVFCLPLQDGTVKIYSRNAENNSTKYPEFTALLPSIKSSDTTSFIIDCEVVAWDRKEAKILPFQALSHRKRKDADESEVTVQVCLFAFDLIYRNGKSFLNEPFSARRKELHDHFTTKEGKFQFAKSKDTTDPEVIESFMYESIKDSCEGLMVKALDNNANYIPDKRNWIKVRPHHNQKEQITNKAPNHTARPSSPPAPALQVKKDYLDGVGDTLDLVPIGAWYGKGKRTGTFGAFLLACYDTESEK